MKIEYNLSITEIIVRHISGMMLGIVGGFLAYYVSPVFLIIAAFAPIMILTAIWGWCPLKSIFNNTKTA
ncbi:MAG: DUF2892 domain-containing protein [Saprospiraceae bacterium]|nr:DUF2892 domain-containing protein [Saprospiraceae bacterium]